mmetsp:Transcript_22882/g.47467  ORF Transcript_22882/g.47467 Transcript_22882/m.47467 type:complete len:204 (+) Transcript_22882:706-1317(+)
MHGGVHDLVIEGLEIGVEEVLGEVDELLEKVDVLLCGALEEAVLQPCCCSFGDFHGRGIVVDLGGENVSRNLETRAKVGVVDGGNDEDGRLLNGSADTNLLAQIVKVVGPVGKLPRPCQSPVKLRSNHCEWGGIVFKSEVPLLVDVGPVKNLPIMVHLLVRVTLNELVCACSAQRMAGHDNVLLGTVEPFLPGHLHCVQNLIV